MSISSKVLLSVFILTFLSFGAWFIRNELHTPRDEQELMNREVDLIRAGRYDKAIHVIDSWLKNPKRDVSRDGWLYHELAMAYMAKAWHKPTGKDESVRQAEQNLEKELDLYNKENPQSLRLDLFEIGAAHEVLGDLSENKKCLYYGMARQELDRQSSRVRGDFYEADGRKYPLAGVRREITKHLDAVRDKSSKANCPNMAGKG